MDGGWWPNSFGGSTKTRAMLPDWVWARHSNPKSGWSRLLAYPVLILAVYARRWTLLGATVVFLLVNPLLFSEPESETDDWMYRAVRAERQWSEGNSFVGLRFPAVLNLVQIPVVGYNLYVTYERRAVETLVSTGAVMVLKLWFVNELVKRYDRSKSTPE